MLSFKATPNLGQLAVPGLQQQVQSYFQDEKSKKIDGKRTLHLLWGAGNDFVFKASLAANPTPVVDSRLKSVTDLIDRGAEHILIFDLPPTEYIPLALVSFPAAQLSLLTAVVTSQSDYFTNTTASCWDVRSPTNIVKNCPNANKFVFVDNIHFSSTVHALIADALQKYMAPSTVRLVTSSNRSVSYFFL